MEIIPIFAGASEDEGIYAYKADGMEVDSFDLAISNIAYANSLFAYLTQNEAEIDFSYFREYGIFNIQELIEKSIEHAFNHIQKLKDFQKQIVTGNKNCSWSQVFTTYPSYLSNNYYELCIGKPLSKSYRAPNIIRFIGLKSKRNENYIIVTGALIKISNDLKNQQFFHNLYIQTVELANRLPPLPLKRTI